MRNLNFAYKPNSQNNLFQFFRMKDMETVVSNSLNKLVLFKTLTLLIYSLCIFSYKASAQFGDLGSNRVATSAFQFLKLGIGAREVAMAESGIAVSNDANALFWNPSHISYLPNYSTSISYNSWFANIYQTSLATVYRYEENSTFGFSMNYLSTEAMDRRTTFQPFGTGEKFNYYDLAVGLTYSRQMTAQFTFGLTGKYIREQLAEIKYSAIAVDLGMTYIMDENDTKLSIALMNFGGRNKPQGTATPPDGSKVETYQDYNTPSNFRMGFSLIPFKNDDNFILTTVQLNHPNDGAENYAIGAEYGFMKTFFFRTGIKLNVEGQSFPSFGFGINKALLSFDSKFDYAASYIKILGFAHRVTLSISIPEGEIR